jgi:hypothetical protein
VELRTPGCCDYNSDRVRDHVRAEVQAKLWWCRGAGRPLHSQTTWQPDDRFSKEEGGLGCSKQQRMLQRGSSRRRRRRRRKRRPLQRAGWLSAHASWQPLQPLPRMIAREMR